MSQKYDIPCILKHLLGGIMHAALSLNCKVKKKKKKSKVFLKNLLEEGKMWMLIWELGMLPICIGGEMTHLL